MATIVRYVLAKMKPGVTREAYDQQLLDELYTKYLDRSYTTSIWTELIEP